MIFFPPLLFSPAIIQPVLTSAGKAVGELKTSLGGTQGPLKPAYAGYGLIPPQTVFMTAHSGISGPRHALGFSLSSYEEARSNFERLGIDEKVARMLRSGGMSVTAINKHPISAWLTFSPFGYNANDIIAAKDLVEARLAGRSTLRIASFGGGFHQDSVYVSQRFPSDPSRAGIVSMFQTIERDLFGDLGGQSHEAREIAAVFRRTGKRVHIEVFDNDSRIEADLRRPRFYFSNARFRSGLEPKDDYQRAVSYWMEYFNNGTVSPENGDYSPHGSYGGKGVVSHGIDFSMEGIHFRPYDLMGTKMPVVDDLDRFDVAFWMNGHYFFSSPLNLLALARILTSIKLGGIFVTDFDLDVASQSRLGIWVNPIFS